MKKVPGGKLALLLLDIFVLQIAFFIIFTFRYSLNLLPPLEQAAMELSLLDYLLPSLILTICWVALFTLFRCYRPEPMKVLFDEFTRVILATSVGVMLFAFLLYNTDFVLEETRLVVLVYWLILLVLLLGARFVYFRFIQSPGEISVKEYQQNIAGQKRLLIVALDLLFIIGSYWGAFQLRFGGEVQGADLKIFVNTVSMVLIVRFTLFAYFRVYAGSYRYASIDDLLQIIKSVSLGSLILVIPIFFIPITGFPRSVLLIDSLLLITLSGGMRLAIRYGREILPKAIQNTGKRVLVIGAGDAGEMIIREMKKSRVINYNPVALVDDDVKKQKLLIHGVQVMGGQSEIEDIVRKKNVEEIIIAIPSATDHEMRQIIDNCRKLKINFKTVPPIKDIINETVSLHQVRDIRVTDLLGRQPLNLNIDLIKTFIKDKRILITGAAGSIGSEICRQLLSFHPRHLIMIDRAENNLYNLQLEISSQNHSRKDFVVADINNKNKMEAIFESYKPDIVYHAAAFKQVPLMEFFPEEAVFNNIFGTKAVLELAIKHNVSHFILISTDKAVEPTSVMGASKKVAELLAGVSSSKSNTKVITVRFGNVLDTDGSVVPLFRNQIEKGGPVTVTDPRITRYFMTISEATLLVLEASALGTSGQLMVLKMGDPIRIVDLAKAMITLSGFVPNEDIEISFIGLRPGEKLEEKLFVPEDRLISTTHEKLLVAEPEPPDEEKLNRMLFEIGELCNNLEREAIIAKLREIIPNYKPRKLEVLD